MRETKTINWESKKEIARKMAIKELVYAIDDCLETARMSIDSGYYYDEASIYKEELKRRLGY